MAKQILLFGIGQTGCTVAELFARNMQKSGVGVTAVAVDTDERTLSGLAEARTLFVGSEKNLSTVVEDVGIERAAAFFPCDWERDCTDFAKAQGMNGGAGLWRAKALLSLYAFLSDENKESALKDILKQVAEACSEDDEIAVYVVASLVGGTGSALYLPLALYLKKELRALGARISDTRALLVMPNVYESCFSADQTVKARANAYAALRELRAVDTAFSEGDGPLCPPVAWRVNPINGEPEVIFGLETQVFGKLEEPPFAQVVLFDRIPGVQSLSLHFAAAAEILEADCRYGSSVGSTPSHSKENETVYKSLSCTRVQYPEAAIVTYITKKQTADFLKREIFDPSLLLAGECERRRRVSYATGDRSFDENECYARLCLQQAEKEGKDPILSLAAALDTFVARTVEGNTLPALRNLSTCYGDGRRVGIFVGKKDREALASHAEDCYAAFKRYYAEAYESIVEKAELWKEDLKKPQENGFSLITHVLEENGEAVSPLVAITRLCAMRELLSEKLQKQTDCRLRDLPDPNALLEKYSAGLQDARAPSRYARTPRRLYAFLTEPSVRLADDAECFGRDLKKFISYLVAGFSAEIYGAMMSAVDEMISAYRASARAMSALEEDLFAELRVSLIASGRDVGTTVNVGATAEEKEGLLQAYREELDTAGDGKIFDPAVFFFTKELFTPSVAAAELAERMEACFTKTLLASPFYKKNIKRNIVEAILDPVIGRPNEKVLCERYSPIRLHRYERGIGEKFSLSLLPSSIQKSLGDTWGEDPVRRFERLMFDAGEHGGRAAFADLEGEQGMLILREMAGFPPHFIEAFDELGNDPTCYRAYLRAKEIACAQQTEMWNPLLVYQQSSSYPLPYINPDMQRSYGNALAKALLFAFMTKGLYTDRSEDGSGKVYYLNGQEKEPLLLGEAVVTEARTDALILWAYAHPDWVWQNAALYDARVESIARATVGLTALFEEIALAFAQAESILLEEKDSPTDYGMAVCVGRAVCDAAKAIAFFRGKEVDELAVGRYNSLLAVCVDKLAERGGKPMAKAVMKKLNAADCMKKRVFPCEECDWRV